MVSLPISEPPVNWQLNMQASQTGLLITVNKMLRGPEVSSQAWGMGWGSGFSVHEYAWQPGILQPLSSALSSWHTHKRQQSASWTGTSLLHLHSSSSSGSVAAASAGALQQHRGTLWALFVFARSCHIQPVSKRPRGNPLRAAGDEVRQAQEPVTRRLTASYLVGFCLDECRSIKSCQSEGNVYISCSHIHTVWRFRLNCEWKELKIPARTKGGRGLNSLRCHTKCEKCKRLYLHTVKIIVQVSLIAK